MCIDNRGKFTRKKSNLFLNDCFKQWLDTDKIKYVSCRLSTIYDKLSISSLYEVFLIIKSTYDIS